MIKYSQERIKRVCISARLEPFTQRRIKEHQLFPQSALWKILTVWIFLPVFLSARPSCDFLRQGFRPKIDSPGVGRASELASCVSFARAHATVNDDKLAAGKGARANVCNPFNISQVARQNTQDRNWGRQSPPPFCWEIFGEHRSLLLFFIFLHSVSFQLNNFFLILTTTFYHHQTNGFVFSLHKGSFCLNAPRSLTHSLRLSIDWETKQNLQA